MATLDEIVLNSSIRPTMVLFPSTLFTPDSVSLKLLQKSFANSFISVDKKVSSPIISRCLK